MRIIPEREKLIKILKELDRKYNEGKISNKDYKRQKREYTQELERLEVVERVRMLQGKGTAEKPLEYWMDKREVVEDKKEQQELIKKYITTDNAEKTSDTGIPKGTIFAAVFLVVAFLIGAVLGTITIPPEVPNTPLVVNESAFSDLNNTTTKYESYETSTSNLNFETEPTPQPTPTPEPTPEPTPQPTPTPEPSPPANPAG